MLNKVKEGSNLTAGLKKSPTGISGFDEITGGGLPTNRNTLVSGGPGCGKSLFAMQFVANGAIHYNEPGLFVAFEENTDDVIKNFSSFGIDFDKLKTEKKLIVESISVNFSDLEISGSYNLDGLFIQLDYMIDKIGAKRVALDTIDAFFSSNIDKFILRAELKRLFNHLKERNITTIVTGEKASALCSYSIEEFVSDCAISMDHRLENQLSTRRLRILKYRGSSHGTNEYPFIIDEHGISVIPITSIGLTGDVSKIIESTGIKRLDAILGGGFYKGTAMLLSGSAGTGKTSFYISIVNNLCERGKKVIYFAFEESPSQIIRNMHSIGISLEKHIKDGLLIFHAIRPTIYGLEKHLCEINKLIDSVRPDAVVVDPVSSLMSMGTGPDIGLMITRLLDILKEKQISCFMTYLLSTHREEDSTDAGISSIVDSWILLRHIELNGERNRGMYILKSRGMAHSNQIREFVITSKGIDFADVYIGQGGVLTGASRATQEAKDRAGKLVRDQEISRIKSSMQRKKEALEAQIAMLKAEFEAEEISQIKLLEQEKAREFIINDDLKFQEILRKSDKKR